MPAVVDYCTDQFLLVRYPSGAGGKFLISSLFLFDEIAHWEPRVQHGYLDYDTWFENTWPDHVHDWVRVEPNQPWELDFYSRRFDRNNNLDLDSFNTKVQDQASSYFHQCWAAGLTIVDNWHKRTTPAFFTNAKKIEIMLDDSCIGSYKKCVMNKVWLWDAQRNTVISTLDHPDWAWSTKNLQHINQFKNNAELTGWDDPDDFFYRYVMCQPWVQPFFKCAPDPECLFSWPFHQLLHRDGYISIMKTLSEHWNQTLDPDQLCRMHDTWISKSRL